MPKKTKPKAVCDGDTPLTPITAKERRKLEKSIKKKYDRFRMRYPEVHGKVVDFITHSIEDGTLYFSVRFKDKTTSRSATRATCSLLALTFATSRPVISR
jgi:hypothetical protein